MDTINWSNQHCGVHQGTIIDVLELMPDLKEILKTFPDNPANFTWDVKVHMLMPGQYPCIPNWHRDMVPRNPMGKEDASKIQVDKPMYLWLSNGPLTEFMKNRQGVVKNGVDDFKGETYFVEPKTWHRFTQVDYHRGHPAKDFTWRGLIRATHNDLNITDKSVNNPFGKHSALRRHCQVYLDANNFNW